MMHRLLLGLLTASLFAQEFKVGAKVADFTVNDSIGRPVKNVNGGKMIPGLLGA